MKRITVIKQPFLITDFEINGPYEYPYANPNIDYRGILIDSTDKPIIRITYKAKVQHRINDVNWIRNKFKSDKAIIKSRLWQESQ